MHVEIVEIYFLFLKSGMFAEILAAITKIGYVIYKTVIFHMITKHLSKF